MNLWKDWGPGAFAATWIALSWAWGTACWMTLIDWRIWSVRRRKAAELVATATVRTPAEQVGRRMAARSDRPGWRVWRG